MTTILYLLTGLAWITWQSYQSGDTPTAVAERFNLHAHGLAWLVPLSISLAIALWPLDVLRFVTLKFVQFVIKRSEP